MAGVYGMGPGSRGKNIEKMLCKIELHRVVSNKGIMKSQPVRTPAEIDGNAFNVGIKLSRWSTPLSVAVLVPALAS